MGAKFEESDLTGSSFQPGTRLSYSLDNQNIIWGAYSHAQRQPSLVEKFTDVSYGRVFVAPGVAFQLVSPANTALDSEKMDAFELGWRNRPSENLLLEFSVYHYDTKDAVFSGHPVYQPNDVQTGRELTFGFGIHLQRKRVFILSGEIDGVLQADFPDTMANLTSHLKLSDNLIFRKHITDDRIIHLLTMSWLMTIYL